VTESARHDSVRQGYDAVAEAYAVRFNDELDDKPLDRALLASLIEQTETGTPIADVGCGPGHVAAWLADLGANAVGIDLSAGMIDVARKLHPGVEYRVGDLHNLPAADDELGGIVAFYSIIHLAPDELPHAFGEMRRVVRPGGPLLLAFHVGTGVRHLDEWWGHDVDIDFRLLETAAVVEALDGAGLVVEMQLERIPYPEEGATRRAYVLGRR
jgi:ubiquinone/menaquinone biosynthesis C-methylase UbiE